MPQSESNFHLPGRHFMKRLFACCLACLGLVSCVPSGDTMETLFGIEHNTVILASSAIELSPTPLGFVPSTEAKVVGKEYGVCVVLAGGRDPKNIEEEAQRFLKGAQISATVTTNDGAVHEFSCMSYGWAKTGRIVPSDEIRACVQPGCTKQGLPVGTEIRSVSISSTAPVHALGAYWNSTAAFDQSSHDK